MAAIKTLIIHGGMYHPFAACANLLKAVFEEGGLAVCDLAERDAGFNQSLDGYDAVAIYTQGGELSDVATQQLQAYVESGKGLVAIHSANATFKDNEAYLKLIGSRFSGHAAGTPSYEVAVCDIEHPLAKNLQNFSVTDEVYQIEHLDDNNEVFLDAYWQGGRIPMAYTRAQGAGRVFYTANGHDQRVFLHPEWQRLALRGLQYAAGRFEPVSRAINVGIVGYGGAFNMGKHHADAAVATGGFAMAGVCDTDPARRAQAEVELNGVKTYATLTEMLSNDDVELVINITPHNAHHPTTMEALRAGRHVAVEKPFCITQAQADEMIEAARANNVSLAVYQSRRWDHHFLTAQKLVGQGLIGQVFEQTLDFGGYGHPGDWWRSDKTISGGLLYDWGAHAIDWMLHINPKRVVGVSGYFQKRKWWMCTNEDHARVVIRFEDGSMANFSNSQINALGTTGWIVLGTEGALHFPTIFDQEASLITLNDGKQVKSTIPCEASDWGAFYRNTLDHLHFGLPLICRGEKSARVIGIIEKAEQSHEAGREAPFEDVYFGR